VFDAFERVVRPRESDAGDRFTGGHRDGCQVRRHHRIDVHAGGAGRSGHTLEGVDGQLAHAGRLRHGRVAARRRHSCREDDDGQRQRVCTVLAKKSVERFEKAACAAGQLGSGLVARRLAGDLIEGAADLRGIVRERRSHAAQRKRDHHRGIERDHLSGKARDGAAELRSLAAAKRFLIDDEDETASGADVVVRAVRGCERCAGCEGCEGCGSHPPQRANGPDAVADPDLHVCGAEVRHRRAVTKDGCEVYGRSVPALAGHLSQERDERETDQPHARNSTTS